MTTLQLIGAKLSLCLPKLNHYGLCLSLCAIFALTTAFRPTEFSIDNHVTAAEDEPTETEALVNNAMMPQTILIPTTNIMDTTLVVDCGEQVSFESDAYTGVQYVDTAARNSVMVDWTRMLLFW